MVEDIQTIPVVVAVDLVEVIDDVAEVSIHMYVHTYMSLCRKSADQFKIESAAYNNKVMLLLYNCYYIILLFKI